MGQVSSNAGKIEAVEEGLPASAAASGGGGAWAPCR
jgi:hypothetical protein